ncbi:MAG: DNA alkylation response protein [Acidimicrobiia bacterium]|nr:MAG: DNA alkylation response protein [Acidimicrobiia bacterium]
MDPTHQVFNQPPPLEDWNPYRSNPVVPEATARYGAKWAHDELIVLGERVGSAEVYRWGFQANRHPPELRTHDRFGKRIDVVEFHPAYHSLMGLGVEHGLHSLPWERPPGEGGHVARAVAFFLLSQVEAGVGCPLSMTCASVWSLRFQPELASSWEPRVVSRVYDPRDVPAWQKDGNLVGMGMTEKQGGSDVSTNTTRAEPVEGSGPGALYRLTGHKWFTSAPMSDAFLMLAQAPGGLSCFLVPRFAPDGTRNRIHLQRLKDKLGNRSNASAELELEGTFGWLIGDEGRGVRTIIEMVNGTRLDCAIGSAAIMRQAVAQAGWHVAHRSAFGSKLIDKPLMQNVLADLELETEAAELMMLRLAAAFDRAPIDDHERAFRRVATPVAKYWVTKRCPPVTVEAMECLGGNGYVEESIMPRLYREAPLNSIWEGSGNVIALDLGRVLHREPDAIEVFLDELRRSGDARVRRAVNLAADLVSEGGEAEARRSAEILARVWAAALLVEGDDTAVADTWIRTRLDGDWGATLGTLPPDAPMSHIAQRAVPEK